MFNTLSDRFFLWRERKHLMVWRQVVWLYVVVFLVWGSYRLVFRFPVWVEEMFFKAVVFGLPVFWLMKKEKWNLGKVGITGDNFFRSVYMGLGVGVILGFVGQVGNVVRHGSLLLSSFGVTSEVLGGFLLLSLVTAFWEELVFSGFILMRLSEVIRRERVLVVVVGTMFAGLHLPALIMQQVTLGQFLLSMVLLLSLGVGNSILMLRSRNLISPIMAHVIWGVTIFLFR